MGKTEKGAVWLDKKLFSTYDYWQYWRNVDDRDVKRFLNFFTDIPPNKVNEHFKNEKNINNLKILLANETTKILHGKEAAIKAEKTAKTTFETGGIGIDLPEFNLKKKYLMKVLKFLIYCMRNKIFLSKSDARRAIKSNGLKINNIVLKDENKLVQPNDFKDKILKISFGKKKHFIIKII